MNTLTLLSVGAVAWGLTAPAAPGSAAAQEYDVDTGADRQVRFVSTTQVNEFEGVTDRIDGYVLLTDSPVRSGMRTDGSKLYFEVELASLDTGIDLRNRHMRDDYLEVGEYPYAKFSGVLARVDEKEDGAFQVTASGTLTIHGVDKGVRLPCDVRPSGRGYDARCAFDLLLSDFDISIPKLMFLKLANQIRLEVAFSVMPAEVASSVMPAEVFSSMMPADVAPGGER